MALAVTLGRPPVRVRSAGWMGRGWSHQRIRGRFLSQRGTRDLRAVMVPVDPGYRRRGVMLRM